MSPGYLVRALNEFASLTCAIRHDGCDAFISEIRQKDKPSKNKKNTPERQKFRRITKRQKLRYQ